MEIDILHTEADFEEWMMENGYDDTDRFAALERFANQKNYTVEELEEGWGI